MGKNESQRTTSSVWGGQFCYSVLDFNIVKNELTKFILTFLFIFLKIKIHENCLKECVLFSWKLMDKMIFIFSV